MGKLLAILDLFRKGSSVADPALWKTGQITATSIAALFVAISHIATAFGYSLPIDQSAADAVAGGLVALLNVVLTVTTSKTIGLPPRTSDGDAGGSQPAGDGKPQAQSFDLGNGSA